MKKGQVLFKAFIEISLALIIISAFFAISGQFGRQEFFFKKKVATEIGLLLIDAKSFPGNSYIAYPSPVGDYSLHIGEEILQLSSAENDPAKVTYPLLREQTSKTLNKPASLYVVKHGNDLSLETEEPILTNRECPRYAGSKSDGVTLLAQGEHPDIPNLISDIHTIISTEGIRQGQNGAKVTLIPGDDDIVLIRYGDEDAKALACHLVNSFRQEWVLSTFLPFDTNTQRHLQISLPGAEIQRPRTKQLIAGGIVEAFT